MSKLSKDLSVGMLHPRENIFSSGNLGSLNAEILVNTDGANSVSLDLRGTFSATIEVSGTTDGVNWQLIPITQLNVASKLYLTGATVVGNYIARCGPFKTVRARAIVWASGAAAAVLLASNASVPELTYGPFTPQIATVTAAVGLIATLTIASPGAGFRHYLNFISITRYAGAVLVASATPVVVTTTNIPGPLAFTIPADAASLGTAVDIHREYTKAIATSAQATATTIVAPATTGVIWRITAGYYGAP